MVDAYMVAALVMGILIFLLWGVSLVTKTVSFVDSFWGAGFVVTAWTALIAGPVQSASDLAPSALAMLTLVSLWGIRLALHLGYRFAHEGEDRRYRALLRRHGGLPLPLYTFLFVFLLQGVLILIISAPIIRAVTSPAAQAVAFGPASVVAVALAVFGLVFETIADWQLLRFKSNPDNAGKVMQRGLWAWSRHPNYFGEVCVWWGLWGVGHDPVYLFAPIFVTFTLLKWSGLPMNEAGIRKRRPDYEAYAEKVSAFLPHPPKG